MNIKRSLFLLLSLFLTVHFTGYAQNNSDLIRDFEQSDNKKEQRINSLMKVAWDELDVSRDSINTLLTSGIELCKEVNKVFEMYDLFIIHTKLVGDFSDERMKQLDELITVSRTNNWDRLEVTGIYWKSRGLEARNEFAKSEALLMELVNRFDNNLEKYGQIHASIYEQLAILNTGSGDKERTINMYKKALKISEDIKDTTGICSSLHNLANEFTFSQDFEKFRMYIDRSLVLAKKTKNKEIELLVYLSYANKFGFNEMFDSCLVYASKAQKLAKEINNISTEAHVTDIMAACYLNLGQLPKALNYQVRAYELSQGAFNKNRTALNVGLVHIEMKDYVKASEYYTIAMELATESESNIEIANVLNHMGYLDLKQNNFKKSLQNFSKANDLLSLSDNPYLKNETFRGLATTHQKLGNSEISNGFIEKALASENSYSQLSELYLAQSRNLENLGNYEMAYQSHQYYTQYKDSLSSISNKKLENTILAQYSVEKAESALAIKEGELAVSYAIAEKEKQKKYFGFALLTLAILSIYLIILRHKKYKKQKEESTRLKLESAQANIDHSKEILQNQSKLILDKNRVINELKESIEAFLGEDSLKNEKIQHFLENKILTKEDWDSFKSSFSMVYPNFISKVSDKFFKLSEAELRLLCLTKLGMEKSEIANMLGILPKSVQRTINRFQTKYAVSLEDGVFGL